MYNDNDTMYDVDLYYEPVDEDDAYYNEPDPDRHRDEFPDERDYFGNYVGNYVENESALREASLIEHMAHDRFKDVVRGWTTVRQFLASLGPIDTDWKRELARKAVDFDVY